MLNQPISHETMTTRFNGLAAYLFQDQLLDEKTLQTSLTNALKQGFSLPYYLVHNKILSSEKILGCCVKHFALPIYNLTNYNLSYLQNPIIKPELICRYRVLPLYHDEKSLHLGMTDPTQHLALSAVEFHTGLRIIPLLISEGDFDRILTTYLRYKRLDNQLESTLLKISPTEEIKSEAQDEDEGPVSEFVNRLIQDAVLYQASDIHIEPFMNYCRIRFRRDGLLHEVTTTPNHLAARIITRLKIMSHLNIAERRLPQDGRMQLAYIPRLDIRINTCPTLFGEKIVLRILDANKIKLDLSILGLTESQQHLFISKLIQPQGLILVTGPTGSGKTITLYGALQHLNQIEKNISSVEDPIEIELPGINQVNINPRIGLDFSVVLRTLLRQDPDIIMVGEIRDTQTATIAIQAAQTGHLVLSSLHTNSALDTITRFQSMEIKTYHFIDAVSLIIAQRLVRKLCPYCKKINTKRHHLFAENDFTSYIPKGCDHCYQGYQGRIGIFELLPITNQLAELIINKSPIMKILELIKKEKWMLLWEAGLEKVKQGVTSLAEVKRVVGYSRE